jgi:hypothetical protein
VQEVTESTATTSKEVEAATIIHTVVTIAAATIEAETNVNGAPSLEAEEIDPAVDRMVEEDQEEAVDIKESVATLEAADPKAVVTLKNTIEETKEVEAAGDARIPATEVAADDRDQDENLTSFL